MDGQKIKAQGTDGNNGVDGSDGVTPKLEIREGYGGFPMITGRIGHSWVKPRERMARMQIASKSRRTRTMFILSWQMEGYNNFKNRTIY